MHNATQHLLNELSAREIWLRPFSQSVGMAGNTVVSWRNGGSPSVDKLEKH